MAKKNTKYAIIILIAIVILSIFIYRNFEATGKLVGPPLQNPLQINPCTGLPMIQCLFTPNCKWDFVNKKCIIATCNNKIMDNGETDVDCGGPCSKCADGKKCLLNADCSSDFCDNVPSKFWNNWVPTFKCKSCNPGAGVPYGGLKGGVTADNIQNCGETGIDCGGGQARYPCSCYNRNLDANEDQRDCNFANNPNPACEVCKFDPVSNVWLAAHCFDGRLDYGEGCTDSGGSCTPNLANSFDSTRCKTKEECTFAGLGFFWCTDQNVCLDSKTPSCYTSKATCETDGFFWCNAWDKCWYPENKDPSCYISKATCEAEGYWWCPAHNACWNMEDKDVSECYISKITCEADGYWWCDKLKECELSKAEAPVSCFVDKASCEANNYFWCSESASPYYNRCLGKDLNECLCYWGSKTNCESKECNWCEFNSACYNSFNCWCFTSKTSCESAGCNWNINASRCV